MRAITGTFSVKALVGSRAMLDLYGIPDSLTEAETTALTEWLDKVVGMD